MAQLCPKMSEVGHRIVLVRRYFRLLWDRTFLHSKPRQYDHIISTRVVDDGPDSPQILIPDLIQSNLVSMNICILGDAHIGKTCFLTKYVGNPNQQTTQTDGINFVHKIQSIQGAHLIFRICELGGHISLSAGDVHFHNLLESACKDSVAIFFMFDLTSRRTLTSIVRWYQEARKWNQTAIPVLIGTKFDEFVQLPMDLQWTIASEARKYAKALNATLFFSSSTYNINVNKVFKFITAKLFNLPWSVERNLTVGEPMIDF